MTTRISIMLDEKDAVAVVRCAHCGGWAAWGTACVHCGAPVV